MQTRLPPRMASFLASLRAAGEISTVDGDEPDYDIHIAAEAKKDGYIDTNHGSFWSPMETIFITKKGRRALGEKVPFTFGERIKARLFGSNRRRPSEWEDYSVPPFNVLKLKDGTEARCPDHVMRRMLADGLWEYRQPTVIEAESYFDSRQV